MNIERRKNTLLWFKLFFTFLTIFWFIGACKTSSIELVYGVFGALFMLLVILPMIKRRYIPKETNEEH